MDPVAYPPPELTLRDYLHIIRRRKSAVFATMAAVLAVGALLTARTTPVFQAHVKLLVRQDPPKLPNRDPQNPLSDLLALAQPESVDTQLELLQSDSFIEEAIQQLKLQPEKERGLTIWASRIKDTNVVELTAESADRELAAQAANVLADEYLARSRAASLKEVSAARRFVERERNRVQRTLARSEQALLAFRKRHRVTQLAAEQESRTKELVELEKRCRENANAISRVAAQLAQVKQQLVQEPPVRRVPTGQTNPRRDTLAATLTQLETQRAALLAEYRKHTPAVATVNAQIKRVKQRLAAEPVERVVILTAPNPAHYELRAHLSELDREFSGLKAERIQLKSQLASERERMNQLGPWEVQLAQLTRSRAAAEKSFLALDEKLQDLTIRENARPSIARIIERATVPMKPARPNRTVNLAIAAMIGLLMGLCVAFLQEHMDDRLTTPEEVDRALGLPVLGYVPAIPASQSPLMNALPPISPITDSYRWLRSSLNFVVDDQPLSTMLITSVNPHEGKSLTAANLAMTMAMEGRRVILVDADLRRPTLHRLLGLSSVPGLSDLLLNDLPVQEALQQTDLPRLQVLTCGQLLPTNPAELLNSPTMDVVIQQLVSEADVVIFDTPPSGLVLDAQLLSTKVDGVLLIADIAEARRPGLEYVREQFERARARIVGLVFTRVRQSEAGGYRYYYYRPHYGEDTTRSGAWHFLGRRNGRHPDQTALGVTRTIEMDDTWDS